MYLKITETERNLTPHPGWLDDTGALVSDDFLAAQGFYPVVDSPPAYNPATQYLEDAPLDEWPVADGRATKGYLVRDYTAAQLDAIAASRQAEMSAAVDAERNRRISLPLPITLPGPRTFSVNMDDTALRNMNGLATSAVLAKVIGSTATTQFITYENTTVDLSPDDLISLGQAVQTRISAMTFAGRTIKNMSPIPADYADDSRWAV